MVVSLSSIIYFFGPFLSSLGFDFECGPKNKKIKIAAAIIKAIFSISILYSKKV